MTASWEILDTSDAVAAAACDYVLAAAKKAVKKRDIFTLVLAGGTTPRLAYELLAATKTDWAKWRFYFGDERCVPPGHRERNSVMAWDSWFRVAGIADDQVFAIPAERGPVQAAHDYRAVIAKVQPFDLVLLGVGEDGHTASLFPGQLCYPDSFVVPITGAPKPPANRVSLGDAAIRAARDRLVIVTGAGKAAAVHRWKQYADVPIARVTDGGPTTVLADKAAMSESR